MEHKKNHTSSYNIIKNTINEVIDPKKVSDHKILGTIKDYMSLDEKIKNIENMEEIDKIIKEVLKLQETFDYKILGIIRDYIPLSEKIEKISSKQLSISTSPFITESEFVKLSEGIKEVNTKKLEVQVGILSEQKRKITNKQYNKLACDFTKINLKNDSFLLEQNKLISEIKENTYAFKHCLEEFSKHNELAYSLLTLCFASGIVTTEQIVENSRFCFLEVKKKLFINHPQGFINFFRSHLPYLNQYSFKQIQLWINALKELIKRHPVYIHDFFHYLKKISSDRNILAKKRQNVLTHDVLIQDLIEDFILSEQLIPPQIIRKNFREDKLLFSNIKSALGQHQINALQNILEKETMFDMLYEPKILAETLFFYHKNSNWKHFLNDPLLYQPDILYYLGGLNKISQHLITAHSYMANDKDTYKSYFQFISIYLERIILKRNEKLNQMLEATRQEYNNNIKLIFKEAPPKFIEKNLFIIQKYLFSHKIIEFLTIMTAENRKKYDEIRQKYNTFIKSFIILLNKKFRKNELISIFDNLIAKKLLSHDDPRANKIIKVIMEYIDTNLSDFSSTVINASLMQKFYNSSEEERLIMTDIDMHINNYFEKFIDYSLRTQRLIDNLDITYKAHHDDNLLTLKILNELQPEHLQKNLTSDLHNSPLTTNSIIYLKNKTKTYRGIHLPISSLKQQKFTHAFIINYIKKEKIYFDTLKKSLINNLNIASEELPENYLSSVIKILNIARKKRNDEFFIPHLYDSLIAGIIAILREKFTKKELEKLGFNFVTHEDFESTQFFTGAHELCDQFLELLTEEQNKKYYDTEAIINARKLLDKDEFEQQKTNTLANQKNKNNESEKNVMVKTKEDKSKHIAEKDNFLTKIYSSVQSFFSSKPLKTDSAGDSSKSNGDSKYSNCNRKISDEVTDSLKNPDSKSEKGKYTPPAGNGNPPVANVSSGIATQPFRSSAPQ